jgi:hypothetical protein
MVKAHFKSIIVYTVLLLLIILFTSCDENDCWLCVSGECYNCNGRGYRIVDSNICDVCNGSGICFNCQGTGRIRSK